MDEIKPALAVEIEAEIDIAAPVEEVWDSLTRRIGEWWDHTFRDEPHGVFLEPHPGGRFFEQFDASGAGALYAIVTYVDPLKVLRFSGPMGMPGARTYVKTYHLEPTETGTRVSTVASTLGDLSPELIEKYRGGGAHLLESLKRHAEGRVTVG